MVTKNTVKCTVRLKWIRPGRHSVCSSQSPWQLRQWKSGVRQQGLGDSQCCRKLAENCFREAQGAASENFSKHSCVWISDYYYLQNGMWEKHQLSAVRWDGSTLLIEGHAHFQNCKASMLACPIIHGVDNSLQFKYASTQIRWTIIRYQE